MKTLQFIAFFVVSKAYGTIDERCRNCHLPALKLHKERVEIMPELPEVETIRRGLKKYIVGKTIEDIEVRLPTIMSGEVAKIQGAKVQAVRRYGKGLVIDLSNGYSIAAHVKMTGQFVYKETTGTKETEETKVKNVHPTLGLPFTLPNKYTHVIFTLSAKRSAHSVLYYNDIRKFGWLKVIKTSEVHSLPYFKGLGPEPFADLTLPLFKKIVASSTMPIKPFLMDQRKISGVGNIYANDCLYAARIDPRRQARSLSEEETHRLYESLLEILRIGIKYGGASETNYINVEGGKGEYQNHFLVYGKRGDKCPRDGETILRIVQSGRSTFFCPVCQK